MKKKKTNNFNFRRKNNPEKQYVDDIKRPWWKYNKEKKEHEEKGKSLKEDNKYIKREIGNNDGILMSNGKKTLVSRIELNKFDKDKLIKKYPDIYERHCNLFNESEFKEKNPELYTECCDVKQSSRLILPRTKQLKG